MDHPRLTARWRRRLWPRVAAAAVPTVVAMHPAAAHAYVGPGAGLTALGTIVALILALVLALVGFVWYPLKRLARRRKANSASKAAQERE